MQSIGNIAAGIPAALTPWPSQKSSSNAALCNFFTGSYRILGYANWLSGQSLPNAEPVQGSISIGTSPVIRSIGLIR
jgi:hypothetical protein